jgi:hypothetical protein
VARAGTVEEAKALLDGGADIDGTDALGYSALMLAARMGNYPVFEYLVGRNARLDGKTRKGCPLQILVGNFGLEDFRKACRLLSDKGFDLDKPTSDNFSLLHYLAFRADAGKIECLLGYKPDLSRESKIGQSRPIDMLQFADYPYTDVRSYDLTSEIETARTLFLRAGSRDIKYAPLTIGNFGNFIVANFMAINSIDPSVEMGDVNKDGYFSFSSDGKRDTACLSLEALSRMYGDIGAKVRISAYTEDLAQVLRDCAESASNFFILANPGNSPLVRQGWVAFQGYGKGGFVELANPDVRLDLFDFTLEDISEVITIEVLE